MNKIWKINPAEMDANMKNIRDEIASILPQDIRTTAIILFEELYTNIAKYAYPLENGCSTPQKPLEIEFIYNSKGCIYIFTDSGIPFNPVLFEPLPLNENQIGGHGIRLIKELSKELKYVRTSDDRNKLQVLF